MPTATILRPFAMIRDDENVALLIIRGTLSRRIDTMAIMRGEHSLSLVR